MNPDDTDNMSELIHLPQRKVFTVSELTEEIRTSLENDFASVWVSGEISNYKCAPSGHVYFTLKDQAAQIKCVIFKLQNRFIKFKLEDGLHVICWGRVSVYSFRGEYQLVLSTIEPVGLGGLMLAFEQLKEKLTNEGLFDPGRKKSLPRLPRTIGLVTSSKGAAVHDMIRIIHRRYPRANIIVSGTSVQGDRAPEEIQGAIQRLCIDGSVEVIVIGRGGGSMEDLWAFNDERVVRAVAECPLPIISAVGHETDFTLTDFAADIRASTPSAAAELVVPDRRDLQDALNQLIARLRFCIRNTVARQRSLIAELSNRLYDPRRQIRDRRMIIDELALRLTRSMKKNISQANNELQDIRSRLRPEKLQFLFIQKSNLADDMQLRLVHCGKIIIDNARHSIEALSGKLSALNPLAVLERGYAIAFGAKDNRVLSDSAKIKIGSQVILQLHKGSILCKVIDKRLGSEPQDFERQPTLLDHLD